MLTQAQYREAVEDLAASIEAPLVAAVDARREEVLAGLGFVARFVASRMWVAVLAMVPILARVALAEILDRFGATTIGEIADLLYAHKSRLEGPHPASSGTPPNFPS